MQKKEIYTVYREGAVTDKTCQKCIANLMLEISFWMMFHGWVDQFKLDQIKILIENNQCYPTWEIADKLKIPKTIKLMVKMKNVSFILHRE